MNMIASSAATLSASTALRADPRVDQQADPSFRALKALKQAGKESKAAVARFAPLDKDHIAHRRGHPPKVLLSMSKAHSFVIDDVRHEFPSKPIYAHTLEDIDRAIDADLRELAHDDVAGREAAEKRRAELDAEFDRQAVALSDPAYDEAERRMGDALGAESESGAELAATVATSMPGLLSMLRYICSETERGNEILDPENTAIMLASTLEALEGMERRSKAA
jgi:hypothetical protein